MRIIVCGSRKMPEKYPYRMLIESTLSGLWTYGTVGYMSTDLYGFTVIHGNNKSGVDKITKHWARGSPFHNYDKFPEDRNDYSNYPDHTPFEHIPVDAEWKVHHPDWCDGGCSGAYQGYCSWAGPRRNEHMLREKLIMPARKNEELLVLGFVYAPEKSTGTYDMLNRAEVAGINTMTSLLN